ncbi:hypothetical protein KW787_01465 [Candidatus Pacearchaeota archaeon]|nr:hypothetical protein [Candidatus Pacearchaeota archaeon]
MNKITIREHKEFGEVLKRLAIRLLETKEQNRMKTYEDRAIKYLAQLLEMLEEITVRDYKGLREEGSFAPAYAAELAPIAASADEAS